MVQQVERCPIHFTENELKLHEEELGDIDYIEQMMEVFQDEGILPADGRVDPEDLIICRISIICKGSNIYPWV